MDIAQDRAIMASKKHFITILHMLADYLAIVLAEHTGLWLQSIFRVEASQAMSLPWGYEYIYIPLMFLLILFIGGAYRFNRPSMELSRAVFKGNVFCFLMYTLSIFLIRNEIQISRYYAFCFIFFTMLYMWAIRVIMGNTIMRRDLFKEPVLLIGAGKTAEILLNSIQKDCCYFYKVVGIIDDNPVSTDLPRQYPLMGGLKDAEKIIRQHHIRTLIMAMPGMGEERLRELLGRVQHITDTILFTPNLVGAPLGSLEISTMFVEQLTIIKSRNNLSRWYNRWLKFMFDMVVTAIGTILISPILLLLAIAVGISNGGRIIFAHQRVGRNGKMFPCYKFQTMVNDADKALEKYLAENPAARKEWETCFKLQNDPRVTKLGAFLRRTSLDELPQIFNVLKGEMSLVGPRPIVREEVPKYGECITEYYMVRPGITGMWQASGRSDTTYEERVAMDSWYVKNWSIWLDMKYLARTFAVVLKKEGAY